MKHWERKQESESRSETEREKDGERDRERDRDKGRRTQKATQRQVCGQIKVLLYQDTSPRFFISHIQKRDSGGEPSQGHRGEHTVCRRGKLGYWQEIGIINPHFMNSLARAMTALAFWLSITQCTCIIWTEMCKTCHGGIGLNLGVVFSWKQTP